MAAAVDRFLMRAATATDPHRVPMRVRARSGSSRRILMSITVAHARGYLVRDRPLATPLPNDRRELSPRKGCAPYIMVVLSVIRELVPSVDVCSFPASFWSGSCAARLAVADVRAGWLRPPMPKINHDFVEYARTTSTPCRSCYLTRGTPVLIGLTLVRSDRALVWNRSEAIYVGTRIGRGADFLGNAAKTTGNVPRCRSSIPLPRHRASRPVTPQRRLLLRAAAAIIAGAYPSAGCA